MAHAPAPARPKAPAVHRAAPARPNPLLDPTRMLSGRSLQDAATSLTNLQINPQVSALAQQIAANNRQAQAATDRVGGFYNQFGQQAQQAVGQQRSIADATNSTLANIAGDTQRQIGQAGQAQQQGMQGLASTGLDGGSLARLSSEIAAQQGNAAQQGQAYRSFGAAQGGNWQGLTAGEQGVGASRATDALQQLSNAFAQANAAPEQKIADLQASRGDLQAKNIGALRDSERNYGISTATLGLNTQKLAETTANDTANRQLSAQKFNIDTAMKDRQFQLDTQKYGQTVARDNYQRAHGLGPYKPAAASRGTGTKGLTTTQMNNAFGQIDQARSAINAIRQQVPSMTTQQVRQALTNGYFIGNVNGRPTRLSVPKINGGGYGNFANSAMDLAYNGYLSPANVNALHQSGLLIHGRYQLTPPRTVAPAQGLGLTGRSPFGG